MGYTLLPVGNGRCRGQGRLWGASPPAWRGARSMGRGFGPFYYVWEGLRSTDKINNQSEARPNANLLAGTKGQEPGGSFDEYRSKTKRAVEKVHWRRSKAHARVRTGGRAFII